MTPPDRRHVAHPGALVLSLDLELAWGLRDRLRADPSYADRILTGRELVPRLLELFEERDIAATWAIVGALFCEGREDWRASSPDLRPLYADPRAPPWSSPYHEEVGDSEDDDPLHFAPSLVRLIRDAPHQEIATHTFCHFETLRAAPSIHTFRADLEAARTVAERFDVRLRSIVFPRNQHLDSYDGVLRGQGIRAYRGNPPGWMWHMSRRSVGGRLRRAGRLLDTSFPMSRAPRTQRWPEVLHTGGLSDVRASFFFRPCGPRGASWEWRRMDRLLTYLRRAAERGELLHLWWHPHNFGAHPEENLACLRALLDAFEELRDSHGMLSLSMRGVDAAVRGEGEGSDEGVEAPEAS